jgi:hypothetical protein
MAHRDAGEATDLSIGGSLTGDNGNTCHSANLGSITDIVIPGGAIAELQK